jgi:signal transduction histidine kinase
MMRDATKAGLTDLRSVIGALAPESTDVSGVARALRPIARRVSEASGAEVSLTVEGPGELAIDGPARLTLVRVFQEALNNAITHGRPSRVGVELKTHADRVTLVIVDDGVGFAVGDARVDGRGLRGMRERVEELGGSFEVESAPGRGARVRATVPRTVPEASNA